MRLLTNTTSGHITPLSYYILARLAKQGYQHSYLISSRIAAESDYTVQPSAATMHHALRSLVDRGWVDRLGSSGVGAGRKANYRLTERGKRILSSEINRLNRALVVGRIALEADTKRAAAPL